jgi:hypothetical protein
VSQSITLFWFQDIWRVTALTIQNSTCRM